MELENFTKNSSEPGKSEFDDLEFPDWSGMSDSGKRVPPEVAFQLCEEYYALFHQQAHRWRELHGKKDLPEFIL